MMRLHIRFLFQKKGDRELGISGIISKHWNNIFIFLWLIEIDISLIAKDWMIKTDKITVLDDGRRFETWIKNPSYMDEEEKTFSLPKWW